MLNIVYESEINIKILSIRMLLDPKNKILARHSYKRMHNKNMD